MSANTSSASSTMQLCVQAEASALTASVGHALSALVSIKAPESAPASRQPLDLVAVVDRSGSMSGSKMKAMKEALAFLVSHGLQKDDHFALVAFDNHVDLRLPRMAMDIAGKKAAQEVVASLQTGGATNLSGGLLRGIDVLSQVADSANANKAVLLFTDGIANNGITDSNGIVTAAQGAMVATPMTVFTFGFGADHSESLLRSLSEQTNGLYYYVEKSDDIPVSFADCLGGLVSVCAQNAVLHIEGLDGSTVDKAHCHYKQEPAAQPGAFSLLLGDIYAEDEKDVLLTLKLPALPAARAQPAAALRATLRFFSVAASKIEEVAADLELGRPEAASADQPMPPRLIEQRERVAVSDALAAASDLADGGRLDEGRALLQAAVARAKASPCAESPVVANVVRDAMMVERGYSDTVSYRCYGSKMSKMSAMSHAQQRSTHNAGAGYERKSKMAMKSMLMSSSSGSAPSMSAPSASPPSSHESPQPARTSMAATSASPFTEAPQPQAAPPKASKGKKKAMIKMPTLRSTTNVNLD